MNSASEERAERLSPWEAQQVRDAAAEAAAIGGRAADEHLDPAQRPLVEAGQGLAEGFELAEEELIGAAEYGDPQRNPLNDAFPLEREHDPQRDVYGEADHEASAEVPGADR